MKKIFFNRNIRKNEDVRLYARPIWPTVSVNEDG